MIVIVGRFPLVIVTAVHVHHSFSSLFFSAVESFDCQVAEQRSHKLADQTTAKEKVSQVAKWSL